MNWFPFTYILDNLITWLNKDYRSSGMKEHGIVSHIVSQYCDLSLSSYQSLNHQRQRYQFSWFYPCNKSSYIRCVYSQCHVDWLKCTEQNVNNQSLTQVSQLCVYSQYHVDWLKCTEQNVNNQNLTQVSQLYVHVSFCLKVIRSWHNLPTGGHGHVICMLG